MDDADDADDDLVVRDEGTSSLFSSVVVDDVAFSLIKSSLAGGGERSSSRLTIDAFIALFIRFYLLDSIGSISIIFTSLLLAVSS